MPEINRVNDPRQVRVIENTSAENEQLRATLDYVAMMADVELPDNDSSMEAINAQSEV